MSHRSFEQLRLNSSAAACFGGSRAHANSYLNVVQSELQFVDS